MLKKKHLTRDDADLETACETFGDKLIVSDLVRTGMRVDEVKKKKSNISTIHVNKDIELGAIDF